MNVLQFMINMQAKDNGVISSVARLQRNLDNADRSTKSLANHIGGSLNNAIHSLPGADFFTNPIVALSAGIGVVTNLGMQNERTAISFEVLLGSASKAQALIKEMKQYANTTPYESADIFAASQTMLGFGVNVQKVMPYIHMLGTIAASNPKDMKGAFSSLTLAFSQINAAGVLHGQDLLQMVSSGYNPLKDLSEMTGKSLGSLKDEMEKGHISAEMVAQALKHATSAGGLYYNMTEKIGKTTSGKLSTLMDSFKEKAVTLYEAIAPILVPALDAMGKMMDAITVPLQSMVDGFNHFLFLVQNGDPLILTIAGSLAAFTLATSAFSIEAAIATGFTKIWAIAQGALNLVMKQNPGVIIFTLLAGALIYAWNKFAGFRAFIITTIDTVKQFGIIIKDYIIDRIAGIARGLGTIGSAFAKLFKGDFKGAWADAKQGASDIYGVGAMSKAYNSAKTTVNGVSGAYQKNLKIQEAYQKQKDAALANPGLKGTKDSPGTTKPEVPTATTNNAATTGGTRNNIITVNVGKFFDNLNVQMLDKMNAKELEKYVIECMTRAINIATSSAQ